MVVRELVNLIGFKIDEAAFRRAEQKVQAVNSKISGIGKTMAIAFTAPFVATNVWLLKNLSNFEQMDISFSTMLGSVEKADILVKDMLTFASETPFEIKNIGETVKMLLATGSTAENVLTELKNLGDVASGLSVPVQRLALNFGQVRAQGKLTGRDLKDFTTAGVNLRAELSKNLGVSIKTIPDMVSTGLISFDHVNEAFRTLSGEGGKFYNLMFKQAKTLGGMWSNFKDILVLSSMSMEKILLPKAKKLVDILIKMVTVFKNLNPTMKAIIWVFGGVLAVIAPLLLGFTLFVKLGMFVHSALMLISVSATKANISINLLMLKFVAMGIAVILTIALVGLLMEDILIFSSGGSSAIGKLVEKFQELNNNMKSQGAYILQVISDLFKGINQVITGFIEGVVFLFNGKWKIALKAFGEMTKGVTKTIVEAISLILQPILDMINGIKGTDFTVKGLVKSGIDKFTPDLTAEQAGNLIHGLNLGLPGGGSISNDMVQGSGGLQNRTKSVNVNANINTYVPEGTTEDQKESVRLTAQEVYNENLENLAQNFIEVE